MALVNVTDVSALAAPAADAGTRNYIAVQNIGTTDVWLDLAPTAVAGACFRIGPGQGWESPQEPEYRGPIAVVCSSGQTGSVSVGSYA